MDDEPVRCAWKSHYGDHARWRGGGHDLQSQSGDWNRSGAEGETEHDGCVGEIDHSGRRPSRAELSNDIWVRRAGQLEDGYSGHSAGQNVHLRFTEAADAGIQS